VCRNGGVIAAVVMMIMIMRVVVMIVVLMVVVVVVVVVAVVKVLQRGRRQVEGEEVIKFFYLHSLSSDGTPFLPSGPSYTMWWVFIVRTSILPRRWNTTSPLDFFKRW
jgi:hypothetical protein